MEQDKYNLTRFIEAQEGVYPIALKELRQGRKRSHWMWYVFPQLKGLGHSFNSQFYGISGLEEAEAYLADPVLNRRLGGRHRQPETSVIDDALRCRFARRCLRPRPPEILQLPARSENTGTPEHRRVNRMAHSFILTDFAKFVPDKYALNYNIILRQ